jgi:phosphoenolpyruvate-protein phosphotransferase (PTS system enzyme I)
MGVLNGLGVSPGIARGRALVLRTRQHQVFYVVPRGQVEAEVGRLTEAKARSHQQIEEIGARLATLAGPGPASLFEAQLLMLEDPLLIGRAAQLIRDERHNAEWALQHAADELIAIMGEADDAYLRERHGDVRDVVGRLILNLRGEARGLVLPAAAERWIVVADELPPSAAAQLNWAQGAGFITEGGSWTSHTAILARSLGVPAVVGIVGATTAIPPGAELLLDGAAGECIVDPDDAVRTRWSGRPALAENAGAGLAPTTGPLRTADQVEIRLDANLERPAELTEALATGALGIGLFRSEFLLGPEGQVPSEADQRETYRQLLAQTPGEVTIRTFDAEPVPGTHPMGLRLLHTDGAYRRRFAVQVRALLASAHNGRLRILLPFVTSVEDVRAARAIITDMACALRAERVEVPPVPVGAMVEVPSAALSADRLAQEADFLSIGTNDLIALTLAVDRNDERASRFYDPLHPALLRLLRFVTRASGRAHRRVAVCGEMAADPRALAVLLGLGLREFSMAPAAVGRARQLVTQVSVPDMRRLVRLAFSNPAAFLRQVDETVHHALDARVRL